MAANLNPKSAQLIQFLHLNQSTQSAQSTQSTQTGQSTGSNQKQLIESILKHPNFRILSREEIDAHQRQSLAKRDGSGLSLDSLAKEDWRKLGFIIRPNVKHKDTFLISIFYYSYAFVKNKKSIQNVQDNAIHAYVSLNNIEFLFKPMENENGFKLFMDVNDKLTPSDPTLFPTLNSFIERLSKDQFKAAINLNRKNHETRIALAALLDQKINIKEYINNKLEALQKQKGTQDPVIFNALAKADWPHSLTQRSEMDDIVKEALEDIIILRNKNRAHIEDPINENEDSDSIKEAEVSAAGGFYPNNVDQDLVLEIRKREELYQQINDKFNALTDRFVKDFEKYINENREKAKTLDKKLTELTEALEQEESRALALKNNPAKAREFEESNSKAKEMRSQWDYFLKTSYLPVMIPYQDYQTEIDEIINVSKPRMKAYLEEQRNEILQMQKHAIQGGTLKTYKTIFGWKDETSELPDSKPTKAVPITFEIAKDANKPSNTGNLSTSTEVKQKKDDTVNVQTNPQTLAQIKEKKDRIALLKRNIGIFEYNKKTMDDIFRETSASPFHQKLARDFIKWDQNVEFAAQMQAELKQLQAEVETLEKPKVTIATPDKTSMPATSAKSQEEQTLINHTQFLVLLTQHAQKLKKRNEVNTEILETLKKENINLQ